MVSAVRLSLDSYWCQSISSPSHGFVISSALYRVDSAAVARWLLLVNNEVDEADDDDNVICHLTAVVVSLAVYAEDCIGMQ